MHRVTVIPICCTFVLLLFVISTLFQHKPLENIQEKRSNVTNSTCSQVAFCFAFHNIKESYSWIREKSLSLQLSGFFSLLDTLLFNLPHILLMFLMKLEVLSFLNSKYFFLNGPILFPFLAWSVLLLFLLVNIISMFIVTRGKAFRQILNYIKFSI